VRSVVACLCALFFVVASSAIATPTAHAFVSPQWRALEAHRGLLGKWRLIDVRGVSPKDDPSVADVLLDIAPRTIVATIGTEPPKTLTYESVIDEDGLQGLTARDDAGKEWGLGVLVETPTQMTIYWLSDDDDVGVAMHFERAD